METCTYGLGAGTEKPTAERRQGALYRAYRSVNMLLLATHTSIIPGF